MMDRSLNNRNPRPRLALASKLHTMRLSQKEHLSGLLHFPFVAADQAFPWFIVPTFPQNLLA